MERNCTEVLAGVIILVILGAAAVYGFRNGEFVGGLAILMVFTLREIRRSLRGTPD